jgi:hypothetical protein
MGNSNNNDNADASSTGNGVGDSGTEGDSGEALPSESPSHGTSENVSTELPPRSSIVLRHIISITDGKK